MRFRPEQHLRRQADFRAVRERGQRLDCGAFTLWCRVRSPDEPPPETVRVGVVASIAAVGPAVDRNRAKRRLRAVFRENQTWAPVGSDLLLVARRPVNRLPVAELQERFIGACRRLQRAKDA